MNPPSATADEKKQAVFAAMSRRGKKYIEKIGYENWDPFQAPKDPIEIRRDKTNRTTGMLVNEFLATRNAPASESYRRTVFEAALGVVNGDEHCRAMYDFFVWYDRLLAAENRASGLK